MAMLYGRTPERQAMLMVESFGIDASIRHTQDAMATIRRGKAGEFWTEVYGRLRFRQAQNDPNAKAYERMKDFVAEHRLQGTFDASTKKFTMTLADVLSKVLMAGASATWGVSPNGTPTIVLDANQHRFTGAQ